MSEKKDILSLLTLNKNKNKIIESVNFLFYKVNNFQIY
jgi:hypothetical protein